MYGSGYGDLGVPTDGMQLGLLPMAQDLIDTASILGVVEGLVSRCRDAAGSADILWFKIERVHEWVVKRYKAHDELVNEAMNALFARDCIWGVADLDHPLLDRYAWELAAEIGDDELPQDKDRYRERGWLLSMGTFESCGSLHEVLVGWPIFWHHDTPHLLVRMVHDPPLPAVSVGLFEPVYVPSRHRHWQLDDRHRDDFAAFMESTVEGEAAGSRWDLAVREWLSSCPDGADLAPYEARIDDPPDYRQLHWPEEPNAMEDGQTC